MGMQLEPTDGWSWRKDRWLVPVLVPFGAAAWLSPLYVGVRERRSRWVLAGLSCLALFVVGAAGSDGDGDNSGAGLLLIASWIGGVAAGLLARPGYDRFRFGTEEQALGAARARIAEREEGRRLAAREPDLARELGVGRPDLPGSDPHGVVDPNAVPAGTLAALPGLDEDTADRIVAVRREVRRFSSAEELATLCDLEPDQLEAVRPHLVFLRP